MFLRFFAELRGAGIPVSLTEYLTLIEVMQEGLSGYSADEFYFLSRAALVKDERNLDRFDLVFARVFKGFSSEQRVEGPSVWRTLGCCRDKKKTKFKS